MHILADDAYLVLVDSRGSEVSSRIPGTMWVAIAGVGQLDVIFAPTEFGGTIAMDVSSRPMGPVTPTVFVDGVAALHYTAPMDIGRHCSLVLDLSEHFATMA